MFSHKEIEKKWQKYWLDNQSFKTPENSNNKKYYVLDMFPYPSGTGLHVGHPEGYTATDIIARFKRLQGYDVLHPIGWDAFGLPAEQYAIKTRNHPAKFTEQNINTFRRQLQALGFSYDYNKEVNTTDPAYYKTTQWIFSQLYKKGLAEIKDIEVNWSEDLGTGLANEEVITDEHGNMISEVGGFPVVKKPMKQWVLKITKYAERLFDDLENLAWPNSLKALQRNWIKNPDGTMHLKDWVFSRQRYWGEPFPLAFDENTNDIYLIDKLPVVLPEMDMIKPSGTGESPLANANNWLYFEKDGKKFRRETNTMPQWAGSSWYYIAYILKNADGTYLDIESQEAKDRMKKWLPVDLYIGGQEHAVLHLLYARFWHKVLYDLNIVPTSEPFYKIVNQGMILGPDGQKMSKSKGNVINPDDIVNKFGGDTLRLYEMFMGPLEDTKPWSEDGVKGIRKWLNRVYVAFTDVINISSDSKVDSEFNKFIKEVTYEINALNFNVAISKMMVFVNVIYKKMDITKEQARDFLIILSMFAPHIAEELLSIYDEKDVAAQKYPSFDEALIAKDKTIIAIQINGKLRGQIEINDSMTEEDIILAAKNNTNVKQHLNDNIIKEIYVPGKIVNIVIKS